MNILVAVLGGNWAMIEAEHPGVDLLDLSFRQLLNVAYSWLRRNTSSEDWKRDFQQTFMQDRELQQRMDMRQSRVRRGKPGGRATIGLKRKAKPAAYNPAMVGVSGADGEPADS